MADLERHPIDSAALVDEELEEARAHALPEHEIDKDGSVGGGIASAGKSEPPGGTDNIPDHEEVTGADDHGLFAEMDADPRKTPATPPDTE